MQCLVLPHEPGDGPWNMAVDQWMLESVIADPSAALLRTYEWSEPTLSLGYFQSRAEAEADPRWRGVPIVRRATGGGAIWHDGELTYALALPAGHPMARRSKDLYRAVHGAIAAWLVERGVPARRRGEAEARVGRDRPLLCFLDRDAEDLVVAGAKVLGSAQRRRSGAILQHGSLRLSGSARTPELPGPPLPEPLGARFAHREGWSDDLGRRIASALGLDPRPHDPGPSARSAAARIAAQVFGDPAWTARR